MQRGLSGARGVSSKRNCIIPSLLPSRLSQHSPASICMLEQLHVNTALRHLDMSSSLAVCTGHCITSHWILVTEMLISGRTQLQRLRAAAMQPRRKKSTKSAQIWKRWGSVPSDSLCLTEGQQLIRLLTFLGFILSLRVKRLPLVPITSVHSLCKCLNQQKDFICFISSRQGVHCWQMFWYVHPKFEPKDKQLLLRKVTGVTSGRQLNRFKQMLSLSWPIMPRLAFRQAERFVTFDLIKANTTRLEVNQDVTIPKGLNTCCSSVCREMRTFLL